MERNYLTDTSLTCAALVCSIGISLSFPSWSSLDGVAWNWGCLLLIVSCLTIVLTFHRIFCLHKKEFFFSKGELIGSILFCSLYVYLHYRGISFYDSFKFLVALCLFGAFKQMQLFFDVDKVMYQMLITNAILSLILGLIQAVLSYQNINGMQDSICQFSISLTVGGIVASHLYYTSQTKRNKFIFLSILLACLGMLIISRSRLGVITFAICTYRFMHKYIRAAFLTISILACIVLFQQKSESTYGRIFIYSTSIATLSSPQAVLLGLGADGFGLSYMSTQAQHLKGASNIERYRADNIVHPLNEFLFLIINYGLISIVTILLVVISILHQKKTNRCKKSLLIAIILFAMFSYPFRFPITWLILIWCLYNETYKGKWHFKEYYYISSFLGITGLYLSLQHFHSIQQWSQAHNLRILGKMKPSWTIYEDIYKSSYFPSEFLYNYSSFLLQNGKSHHSLTILKRCRIKNYDTELLKGDIYFSLQQYSAAIKHYKSASQMCPNRFIPLYAMYKSYGLANKKQLQRDVAKSILTKQIKIYSPTITNIINNVKQSNI